MTDKKDCNSSEHMDFKEIKERFGEVWESFIPDNVENQGLIIRFREVTEKVLESVFDATKDSPRVYLKNGSSLPGSFVAIQIMQSMALFYSVAMTLNHVRDVDISQRMRHVLQHIHTISAAQQMNLQEMFEAFTIKLIQEVFPEGSSAEVILDFLSNTDNGHNNHDHPPTKRDKKRLH